MRVHEAVAQGDDAGGVKEHFALVGEGAVGGDQSAVALVAAVDQLEQHVGMAIAVGPLSSSMMTKSGAA